MIRKDSLVWAIEFLQKHSDGDLFPRILEFDAIKDKADLLADKLSVAKLTRGAIKR